MGKGSTGTEKYAQYADLMGAKIALKDYEKREPLLDTIINRSTDFMNTGDISQSQYLDPVKNSVADQLAVAKNSALENMPVGGGMFDELGNQFLQGGQSIIDNVLLKELDNAMAVGLGAVPNVIQGLGTAGGNLSNLANAQANRAGAEIGGFSNLGSGICCFIFIAGHGYLHPIVRKYRDEHMTERNRRGYYWLSDRLVPAMKKSKYALFIVRLLMIYPMTSYGKWFYKKGRIGWLFTPIAKGWLKIFDILGKRPPYRRRGTMEVV